jgi:hypothetical protein
VSRTARNPDRVFPKSAIVERELVGAILAGHPSAAIVFAKLQAEYFTSGVFRIVFLAAKKLHAQGKPYDILAVSDQMSEQDLVEVGGLQGLGEISADALNHYDIDYACQIIVRRERQRDLIRLMEHLQDQAWTDRADPDALIDKLQEELATLRARTAVNGNNSNELRVYTPAELAALVAEPVEPIAYPLAFRGMFTVLDGLAKASGKTTLSLHAIRSSLRREPFLGRATEKVNVLFVTEEFKRTFILALDRAGLSAETAGLHILPRQEWSGVPWTILAERLEQLCRKLKIGWLLTDTFFAICGLNRADQQNDPGLVDAAAAPLRSIAGTLDLAVQANRHERKSGGSIGESGMGSTALTGAADVVVRLQRIANASANVRELEITGRIDGDLLKVELLDGRYVIRSGDVRRSAQQEADAVARVIAADRQISIRTLAARTKIGRNRIPAIASSKGWTLKGSLWEYRDDNF